MTEDTPAVPAAGALALLLAAAAGGFAAAVLLPAWMPGMADSLLGPEPKAYWYLSRASAFVAFGLLWLAMAIGLLITSRLSRLWPGGPTAFELHQHASLLGLAAALFHALILMGDRYANYSLAQILVPFAIPDQRLFVGVGQVGLYLMALVGLSFYARQRIGRNAWRLIHFGSFAMYLMALLHGVQSGTDSAAAWPQALYWLSAASLLFLTIYRVMTRFAPAAPARPRRPAA